jgi:hypothetical protein
VADILCFLLKDIINNSANILSINSPNKEAKLSTKITIHTTFLICMRLHKTNVNVRNISNIKASINELNIMLSIYLSKVLFRNSSIEIILLFLFEYIQKIYNGKNIKVIENTEYKLKKDFIGS